MTGGDCGEVNMAVNPWVGYEADAYLLRGSGRVPTGLHR